MGSVLDLRNLRDIIDHDKAMEQQLIMNFHNCYRNCIDDLESSLKSNNPVQWRNAAHALKGIAFNLGAEELATLSFEAELASGQTLTQKAPLLAGLKIAYGQVQRALADSTENSP